jgi:hypothetical protein
MERRTTPSRDWVIGKDDTGRAVLEWKVGSEHADPGATDPCARTYDFLERLYVPELKLEEDANSPNTGNPYDHCPAKRRRPYWLED